MRPPGTSTWSGAVVLLALLAGHALAQQPATAQGSTRGFFGLAELGPYASRVDPHPPPELADWYRVYELWGFRARAVGGHGWERLVLAAALSGVVDLAYLSENSGVEADWSQVGVTLAAPDVARTGASGFRLMPVVGLTLPTRAELETYPVTVPSVAVRASQRAGPVEVAFRAEVRAPVYTRHGFSTLPFGIDEVTGLPSHRGWREQWSASGALTTEWWVKQRLSLGATARLEVLEAQSYVPQVGRLPTRAVVSQNRVEARVFLTWAFWTHGGLAAELATSRATYPGFGDQTHVSAMVGFFFRSDAGLQRNWLDR